MDVPKSSKTCPNWKKVTTHTACPTVTLDFITLESKRAKVAGHWGILAQKQRDM